MAGYSTKENKRVTKGLLIHYMEYAWRKAGLRWDSDTRSEVGSITDHIFDEMSDLEARIAALEEVRTEAEAEAHNDATPDTIRLVDSDPNAPEFIIRREDLAEVVYASLGDLQANKESYDEEGEGNLLETTTELYDWLTGGE